MISEIKPLGSSKTWQTLAGNCGAGCGACGGGCSI
jgi:hypothetical protein